MQTRRQSDFMDSGIKTVQEGLQKIRDLGQEVPESIYSTIKDTWRLMGVSGRMEYIGRMWSLSDTLDWKVLLGLVPMSDEERSKGNARMRA